MDGERAVREMSERIAGAQADLARLEAGPVDDPDRPTFAAEARDLLSQARALLDSLWRDSRNNGGRARRLATIYRQIKRCLERGQGPE